MTKKLLIWPAQLYTIISSCTLLFGVKEKRCVILCGFKATSVVNTGLVPLVFVHLSVLMEFDTYSVVGYSYM